MSLGGGQDLRQAGLRVPYQRAGTRLAVRHRQAGSESDPMRVKIWGTYS